MNTQDEDKVDAAAWSIIAFLILIVLVAIKLVFGGY